MFPAPIKGVLVCHVFPQSSLIAINENENPSEYSGTISRFASNTNGCARVIQPNRLCNLSAAFERIETTQAIARSESAAAPTFAEFASTFLVYSFTAASNSSPGVTCRTSLTSHFGGPSPL